VHHPSLATNGVLAGSDTRDPNHLVAAEYDGPSDPERTDNSGISEKPFHSTTTTDQVSYEAIAWMPLPDNRFCGFGDVNSPGILSGIWPSVLNTSVRSARKRKPQISSHP
jgi:hypothetical protein